MLIPSPLKQLNLRSTLLSIAVGLASTTQAVAMELNLGDDSELAGSFDVTLGYAAAIRATDARQKDWATAPNVLSDSRVPDSGDVISNIFKTAVQLKLDWRNYGFVSNATYQYDTEIMNGDAIDFLGNSTDWTDAAEDYAGSRFDLLDAYIYAGYDIGENPLEIRAGKQVINWGEGLFFIDGISIQVPLNFNKLVTPGSELKEAFIGVDALYAQMGIGDASSIEAYLQTNWRRTEFPPRGTFYGDDAFFRGGEEVDPVLEVPMRDRDQEPDDNGKLDISGWGVSGRTTLGDTEYGAYYSRYHETLPFVTANTPGLSLTGLAQIWPEDLDMFGLSMSTTVGTWSVSAEIAYRPDRPLFQDLSSPAAFTNPELTNVEEHDTASFSVNGIWLGGALPLGIDAQVVIVQFGLDYVDGDLSNLMPQNFITRGSRSVDDLSYGAIVEWAGTWQSFRPGTDLSLDIFLQKDIHGNSHFWGNFAEDRLLGAITLTAAIGNAWEASAGYSWADLHDSHYETQDVYNLSVNYKF